MDGCNHQVSNGHADPQPVPDPPIVVTTSRKKFNRSVKASQMNLPTTTIVIGVLLMLQGAGFYFVTETKSMTALIPAMFGLPIALLGGIALKESLRKHAMHGAVVLALLGMLAPFGRIASAGLKFSPAGASLVLMIVLCGVLLVLGIQSFVDARRRRSNQS